MFRHLVFARPKKNGNMEKSSSCVFMDLLNVDKIGNTATTSAETNCYLEFLLS